MNNTTDFPEDFEAILPSNIESILESLPVLPKLDPNVKLPPVKEREPLRVRMGLSRKQLGELLGVSHATIGAWERGDNEPKGHAYNNYLRFCQKAQEIITRQDNQSKE